MDARIRIGPAGYCLEMICADFLAGANLENGNTDVLLTSRRRFFASQWAISAVLVRI